MSLRFVTVLNFKNRNCFFIFLVYELFIVESTGGNQNAAFDSSELCSDEGDKRDFDCCVDSEMSTRQRRLEKEHCVGEFFSDREIDL